MGRLFNGNVVNRNHTVCQNPGPIRGLSTCPRNLVDFFVAKYVCIVSHSAHPHYSCRSHCRINKHELEMSFSNR